MIKEYIGTGKTVEIATQAAKLGLNAPELADIQIEVIEKGSKGFLGFGAKLAQVKVSYDDGVQEVKKNTKKEKAEAPKKQQKQAPKKQNQDKKPVEKQAPKKAEPKKEAPKKKETPKKEAPVQAEPKKEKSYPETVDLEYAKQYFAEIVEGLKVENAKISAEYCEGVVTLTLDCDDYGIIIGRRGQTLDSIQYLLSLAMKKKSEGQVRVTVNVGNYREKRNETLQNLAKKNASYVLRTGKRYTFEPMNPYERRVIHTTIQGIEGVESRSIGYNQDRRVVLEPTGGVKPRPSNNRKPAPKQARPQADREKKIDRADVPKFGKIEVPNKD